MTFGEKITKAQERKGIKTLPLSKATKMNRGTLQKLKKMNYHPLINQLNRLCEQLDITPNELFSYGEFEWDEPAEEHF